MESGIRAANDRRQKSVLRTGIMIYCAAAAVRRNIKRHNNYISTTLFHAA